MSTSLAAPIRLLHVFSTFDVGGPQVRFVNVAARLGGKYHHTVIATDHNYAARSLIPPEVPARILDFEFDKRKAIANLSTYRRVIRESGAARLFTYNWGAIDWAFANLVAGVPHVHLEDGFGPDEVQRQLARRVWFRRLALARARPIVVPSRTLEAVARAIWKIPARKLAFIPNSVDCTRFQSAPDQAICAQLGIDGRVPVIGTVSGLRPEKNIARLIRAFARVLERHPARLVVVGTGGERDALDALASQLGVSRHVAFAGHHGQVERILGAFSIYAISSDTEQMPLGLIEAMAAGLPVAAVDVGDVAIMVSAPNRSFITPVDDSALADTMVALLENPGLRASIGAANAIKARAEYDEANTVAAFDGLYGGTHRPA